MSGVGSDRIADIAFYGLLLLLPMSALLSRRASMTVLLRSALSWIAIFGIGLLLVAQRDRIADWLATATGSLEQADQTVVGSEVRIRMAADGHFWADATIDGVRSRMLIDSGATTTALSVGTAEAADLNLDRSPFPVILNTAFGQVAAKIARVNELKLGGIAARNVSAVVSPAFGDTDVLGMNFLSQLQSWRVEGRTLILTPKPKRT